MNVIANSPYILKDQGLSGKICSAKRFQIMFMSMGEPFLNYTNVSTAIQILHDRYREAELLVSTIAPKMDESFSDFVELSKSIEKIGLQFSIHKAFDEERNVLIPFPQKYDLRGIRDYGILWWKETGRHPYLNYCIDGTNNSEKDADRLMALFSPVVFSFTFSVVCSKDETMKEAGFKNLEEIRNFEQMFLTRGYNTRIFDPAGQDDIGGGCGQLWYVQKWMKEHKKGVNL